MGRVAAARLIALTAAAALPEATATHIGSTRCLGAVLHLTLTNLPQGYFSSSLDLLPLGLRLFCLLGVSLSLVLGLLFGLSRGVSLSLGLGLCISLSLSLCISLSIGLCISLSLSLCISLSLGLFVGLSLGFCFCFGLSLTSLLLGRSLGRLSVVALASFTITATAIAVSVTAAAVVTVIAVTTTSNIFHLGVFIIIIGCVATSHIAL